MVKYELPPINKAAHGMAILSVPADVERNLECLMQLGLRFFILLTS
jgi:hypothetical protein